MMTVKSGIFLQLVGASEPVDSANNGYPCVKYGDTPAKCDYHGKKGYETTTYCYTEHNWWWQYCTRKGHNDETISEDKCNVGKDFQEKGWLESEATCGYHLDTPYTWCRVAGYASRQLCKLKDVTEEVSEDTTAVKEDTPTTTKEPKLI